MSYAFEIAQLAEEVTKTQKFLHPMIFDFKGRMYEDIRQKLLNAADFFIRKSIADISSLEVREIILCGSCARYLYNKDSDIDLKVLVGAKAGGCIQNTEKAINDLLSLIAVNCFGHKTYLTVNKMQLDIKFEAKFDDFLGCYSLTHNRWIILPQKYPAEGIDKDLLIKGYFGKLAEISGFMAEIPMENGVYAPAEIERINVFFSEINHPALNAKDYFTYRLLCKSGNIHYLLGDKRFRVQQGDILLIPPGVSHQPLFPEPLREPYSRYVIWINAAYWHQQCEEFPDLNFAFEQCQKRGSYLLRSTRATWSGLFSAAAAALKETEEQKPGWGYCARTAVISLT